MNNKNYFKSGMEDLESIEFVDKINKIENEKEKIKEIINSKYVGSKFEPIVDSFSGEIQKFEVLLEVNPNILKSLGLGFKNNFLNKCEELNLSKELTYKHIENIQVLEKLSIEENTEHINNETQYSVNLGSYEMTDKNFMKKLKNLESINPKIISKIQFEMLETIPIEFFSSDIEVFNKYQNYNKDNMNQRDEFFEFVKSTSLKINIDDLGTGFSNVEKINKLIEIFNSGKEKKFHAIKLDKDVVLYNMLHTQMATTNNKKERKAYFDRMLFNVRRDFTSDIENIIKEIKLNSHNSKTLKEKMNNFEMNGNLITTYKSILSHVNNEEEGFIKFLNEFQKSDLKSKDKLIRLLMKERMKIVIKETKEIVKCLENEGKDLQLIREFREDKKVMSYLYEKFGQINQLQGYGVFDSENLININNKQEYLNKESLNDNLNIHYQKSQKTTEESIDLLKERYQKNKLYYKKLELTNKQEANLLVQFSSQFDIEEIKTMSDKEINEEIKKYMEKNNLKVKPDIKIESVNELFNNLELSA